MADKELELLRKMCAANPQTSGSIAVASEEREAAVNLLFSGHAVELRSARWKETDFGDVLKLTIQHADGWRINGSAPSAVGCDEAALIGRHIAFDARVSVSDNDPSFGFYKRPTKVEIEEAA